LIFNICECIRKGIHGDSIQLSFGEKKAILTKSLPFLAKEEQDKKILDINGALQNQ